jgi:hypothetical protein
VAAVQARGDVRGGQECLRLHLVVVLSFFLVFRSPRHSLLIQICVVGKSKRNHFTSLLPFRAQKEAAKKKKTKKTTQR